MILLQDKPNEAESLFKNIESFASTFRSILELYQLHNVSFSDQNFGKTCCMELMFSVNVQCN